VATTNLEFLILAKDQASEAFEKVSSAVDKQKNSLDKLKVAGTIAAAALVAGVAKFSSDSVEAYAEAQQKQTQLEEAFKKFPALGDTNIDKLNELNDAIQRKTGFDHNDLAASQAKLAVYGLTGDQIAKLTPLIADYAAKTGVDVATASEKVGKAMLGQGRALKDVGINFKDTKSVAGNFNEVLGGLQQKISGTADAMGETATGKVQILKKSYEDLQERIGQMLVPVLTTLVDVGQHVMDWMQKNPAIVTALAIVIGVLTVAIMAVAVAMWVAAAAELAVLWPILLVAVAIAALITIIVLLATHWGEVTKFIQTVWQGFISWITQVITAFGAWWNNLWATIGKWIQTVWQGFITWIQAVWNGFVAWLMGGISALANWWNRSWNDFGTGVSQAWNSGIVGPIRSAWEWITNAISTGLGAIQSMWNGIWSGLGGIVHSVFGGIISFVAGGVNGVIDVIDGMITAFDAVSGAVGGPHIGTIGHIAVRGFASGTPFAPGGLAVVGENGPELMNVPRGSQITPNGGVAVMRLHPDDLRALGDIVIAGITRGSLQAITQATW